MKRLENFAYVALNCKPRVYAGVMNMKETLMNADWPTTFFELSELGLRIIIIYIYIRSIISYLHTIFWDHEELKLCPIIYDL